MDCFCPLYYEPVCVLTEVYSNTCFAECDNKNVTGWFNTETHSCSDYKQEGDWCGGYMPPEQYTICQPNLSCVNTEGQFIVDNPGVCKSECVNDGSFDNYGECIPDDCHTWFDGCNNCTVQKDKRLICTEKVCNNKTALEPNTCRDENNCEDVFCPFCHDDNETRVAGDCCGGPSCYEPPIMCCLAMTPDCFACQAEITIEEWCLSNVDSEWTGEGCERFLPVQIYRANLKSFCSSNRDTVNCREVELLDKFDTELFFGLFGFGFVLLISVSYGIIRGGYV